MLKIKEEIEIMSKLQKKAIDYKFRKRNNMVFNDDEYASFIIFDKIKQLQQENKQLKDNWNKLREWIVYHKHNENTEERYLVVDYGTLLGKMQELEKEIKNNYGYNRVSI